MADFDNFDAIGLSGEADPLFLRRYPPVMDREVGYFEGALGFCSRGSTDWPFERDRLS